MLHLVGLWASLVFWILFLVGSVQGAGLLERAFVWFKETLPELGLQIRYGYWLFRWALGLVSPQFVMLEERFDI